MGEGGVEVVETPVKNSAVESKTLSDQQEKNDSWRLIEAQPLREEQVQNAVNFLSHPKVKGSPIVYRRSFLEKKGLTKEEIDEAFRRVPDQKPSEAKDVTSSQGGEKQSPGVSIPKVLNPPQAPQYPSGQVTIPTVRMRRSRLPWTQMVLAIGVFAAAGAGAAVLTKNYIYPKFKTWLRNIVLEDYEPVEKPSQPSSLEEAVSAAAAATAAATAAREIAVVTRDILRGQSEDRQYLENMMKAMETQTQELKLTLASMRDTVLSIQKAANKSAVLSLPVNGSENLGNAGIFHNNLGSLQQSSKERKPWEKPQNSFPAPIVAPSSEVPDSIPLKPTSDKSSRIPSNNVPSDREKSSVVVASTTSSSSSEPWWRRKNSDQEYARASSSWTSGNHVRITELDPDNETNVVSASNEYSPAVQPGSSIAAVSSIMTEARQGWVPPPVPQTVLPGAAAAIRHQKVVTNDFEIKPSSTSYLGSIPSPSSSGGFETEPSVSTFSENSFEPNAQRAPSPESNGQELNIISENITDKPSYKDVVVEGGEL